MNQTLFFKAGRYYEPASRQQICAAAAECREPIIGKTIQSPAATISYLTSKLAHLSHEVFCVVYLDNRHRVIRFNKLFRGTIDGTSVHPREVVKESLACNAAAVILAHNHPSGDPEPSQADQNITRRLRDALALVDIRVLDHIVIGGNQSVSLAERGML